MQNAPGNALVCVEQGTYLPDSGTGLRGLSFAIGTKVTSILGGFAGFGTPFPNTRNPDNFPTILSGDLNGDDLPGFVNRGNNNLRARGRVRRLHRARRQRQRLGR